MAIELQATYSKKLGLPNYSSHCFIVSLRTELTDLSHVEAESTRLYTLLQQSVDREVQQVGFLPDATTYGQDNGQPANRSNGKGRARRSSGKSVKPTASTENGQDGSKAAWNCSDKQRELIEKLGKQARMDWAEIEHVATQRFDQNVKSLDRKQASILIGALLDRRDEATRTNGTHARR